MFVRKDSTLVGTSQKLCYEMNLKGSSHTLGFNFLPCFHPQFFPSALSPSWTSSWSRQFEFRTEVSMGLWLWWRSTTEIFFFFFLILFYHWNFKTRRQRLVFDLFNALLSPLPCFSTHHACFWNTCNDKNLYKHSWICHQVDPVACKKFGVLAEERKQVRAESSSLWWFACLNGCLMFEMVTEVKKRGGGKKDLEYSVQWQEDLCWGICFPAQIKQRRGSNNNNHNDAINDNNTFLLCQT